MSVLVSGSIAIDDVKTPLESHKNLLGGSASYAAISSSFFAPTQLLGVVGHDFPKEHMELLEAKGIDTSGIERSEGKSFRWSGEYFDDLNTRETLDVQLNVIENYRPIVGEAQAGCQIALLANMAPAAQIEVLAQCRAPLFTLADTMDLWINHTRNDLDALLKKIDLLVLNDSEAKLMTGSSNLITAGHRLLESGPKYIVLKKGEHGALIFSKEQFFSCGAYPLREVRDPTGAGDSFVGALAGCLCRESGDGIQFEDICRGVIYGTILASFNCESFSTRRLETITSEDIEARFREFMSFTQLV